MKSLFVCYLGGKLKAGRVGEDHEVIVVVAENLSDAKKQAKSKWQGEPRDVHVDHITELKTVDGYAIQLIPESGSAEDIKHYDNYDPL